MSGETKDSRRGYLREYTKRRRIINPELHDKDKERSRKYISERRKDPEYRKMENLKRNERRRLKRESLITPITSPNNSKSNRSHKSKDSKSQDLPYRTTQSLLKLRSRVATIEDSLTIKSPIDDEDDDASDRQQELAEEEDYIVTEIEPDVPLNNATNPAYQITVSGGRLPVDHSIVQIVDSSLERLPNNNPTESKGDISLTDITPVCNCSRSLALSKLSAISRTMTFYERQRFESGLLQFAEDFMSSEAQDPFMMLICDKLKRVPADERPDLEVMILKTINDSLKRTPKPNLNHF